MFGTEHTFKVQEKYLILKYILTYSFNFPVALARRLATKGMLVFFLSGFRGQCPTVWA